MNADLITHLINSLENSLPEIKFEAMGILSDISRNSPDYIANIIKKAGLPQIIALIDSPISEIQEQVIWFIGNSAFDSVLIRDKIISLGGLVKITSLLATTDRDSLIKHCVWTLNCFCKPDPPMPWDQIKLVI